MKQRSLKRWWHKIRGFESFRVCKQHQPSSVKMDYKSAQAFMAVYGGFIWFDPDVDISVSSPL